jgi:hypothetical protein
MGQIKKLIITIDIDNDFVKVPLEDSLSLQWDGLLTGLPVILECINHLAKNLNHQIAISIFCRADWQIEELMGSISWVFKATQKILDQKKYDYLKIALEWHPHLYQKSADGKWTLAFDKEIQKQQLIDVFRKLKKENIDFVCSRIGECYFSQTILETLIELQIPIDSSAFSGRNIGHTDWSDAPHGPYCPNADNFTQSGNAPLIMVPFSMIPIKAPYEEKVALRYLNLIFDPKYTQEGIQKYSQNTFVTILHPYEILTLAHEHKHQLFGNIDSVEKNLKLLLKQSPIESILLRNLK